MPLKTFIPVVVGVGDYKNKSTKLEDGIEPMKLMLESIHHAIKDTRLSPSAQRQLQSKIDSIDVVATWTMNYSDLPGLIAENLGVNPKHKLVSDHHGDSPAMMFDDAARRISLGENRLAVVTGGEALASLGAFAAAKQIPPPGWTKPDPKAGGPITLSGTSGFPPSIGKTHQVGLPIQVYPLYENGFRAHRKQSPQENNKESAQLYESFAKVAAQNPMAWSYGQPPATAEVIGTVSKKNRMICFPYPLLMNAFNNINLAGSCLLTSTEYAEELGIPESQWIYPLGGAGTSEPANFWERENFYSSKALSRSLDTALEVSGLTKDEIDIFDFYSCFPIVPKLACHHLNIPIINPPKPVTLLGGLTSFGGAGNNYAMHSIIEVVLELRKKKDKTHNGLILGNGGVLTNQHVVCLSSKPKISHIYPEKRPLPHDLPLNELNVPPVDEIAVGEAIIETYTVEFKRDDNPLRGYIVGRLQRTGHRFVANHGDEGTLKQLAANDREQIGRTGWVKPGERGVNLFSLDIGARL